MPLDWTPPPRLSGRYALLGRLGPAHIDALHAANPQDAAHWAYMPYGPFPDARSTAFGRTPAATEAIHLRLEHAFACGFRRVEWKCNAENGPSRRAAARYGFAFEGTFRQHMVVKGRNRDTAWFALLDGEWRDLRSAHRAWLDPANFDDAGTQRRTLADLTAGQMARR